MSIENHSHTTILGCSWAGATGREIQPIKYDIRRICDKMKPVWRLYQSEVADTSSIEANIPYKNRPKRAYASISSCSSPPRLSTPVDCTTTVHVNVMTTDNPECAGILELKLERMGYPIRDIVSELKKIHKHTSNKKHCG
jgi:hypothetical protein